MSEGPFWLDRALLPESITDGAWAVTSRDHGEQIDCVYPTEIEALRTVVARGFGGVTFVHWGEDILGVRTREKAEASE